MIRVVSLPSGEFGIQSHYSQAVIQACKQVPGMRWDNGVRAWVGYYDAVEVSVDILKSKRMTVDSRELTLPPADNALLPVKARDIRPYQALGANWILQNSSTGCLLADEMGLGKTLTTLRAMRALRHQGYSLAVCPNMVKGTWVQEAKKWWPEGEVVVLEGTKPEKRGDILEALTKPPPKEGGRLLVCNYDILHAWVLVLTGGGIADKSYAPAGPPMLLAFDEAQYLQSETSRRSKAAKAIAAVSPRRVALTGTPPMDRPEDAWNLVDVISPGRFGKFFSYGLRYCDGHKEQVTPTKAVWNWKGKSNTEELAKRFASFTLRRTQKEVALELPPLQRQTIPMEIEKGQRVSFTHALKDDRALRRALDLAADGKVSQVIELVRSHLDAGRKVAVGCHRRLVAETIAGAFEGGKYIHGEMDLKKRREVLSNLPPILASTFDTTGVGLNELVYYDVAVAAELHYKPSTLAQWEKRFHRPGQQSGLVLIQYTIAEGTADELIRDACISKLQTITDLLGGKLDDGLLEELDGGSAASGAEALRKLAASLLE